MAVTIKLSGEGIEFDGEVSANTAVRIMELSVNDGDIDEEVLESGSEMSSESVDSGGLPDNFFNRLSSKQEAMLGVLVEAEEPLTSTELRRRMETEYGEETSGGRALAGILAGFTRKYSDDFEVVSINWGDGEGLYRLHQDYEGELEDWFKD